MQRVLCITAVSALPSIYAAVHQCNHCTDYRGAAAQLCQCSSTASLQQPTVVSAMLPSASLVAKAECGVRMTCTVER